MHIHKTLLEGPISKDRPWWHAAAEEAAAEGTLFRAGLVDQIRREIAAGTYETPEKLEAALERLLGSLQ
jgi:hypothetical protein